jgi:hypothetical protein
MLPVSLDCPFLITSSVFTNVYFIIFIGKESPNSYNELTGENLGSGYSTREVGIKAGTIVSGKWLGSDISHSDTPVKRL